MHRFDIFARVYGYGLSYIDLTISSWLMSFYGCFDEIHFLFGK